MTRTRKARAVAGALGATPQSREDVARDIARLGEVMRGIEARKG